jgi:recombination protein U
MIFNGTLYLLELKSHKGKSIPFSAIRQNQVTELSKASTYKNMICGSIVNFRDVERTYFVSAVKVEYFLAHADRQSIPIAWFETEGCEIKGRKLKVHFRWNIEEFLKEGEGE